MPPSLAYGDEGRPEGGIPRNAWLLFVVNLIRVGRHKERGQRGDDKAGQAMPLPSEFLGKNKGKLLGRNKPQQEPVTGKKRVLGRREKRRLAKRKAAAVGKFDAGKAVRMKHAKARDDDVA